VHAVQAGDVQAFRESINDITALMTFELDAILRDAFGTGADPVRIRNVLLTVVPEVVSPFMDIASASAATWYEDMRRMAYDAPYQAAAFTVYETGKNKTPLALAAKPDQLEATIRNGLAPLFGKSDSSPLMLIGGGMQRHVTNAARGTVIDNATRDTMRVGYQRFTSPGCCKFCAMVASRGAAYSTRGAAGGVQGRGVDPSVTAGKKGGKGKGLRARGAQSLGSKYHDHCRCVVGPVFVGDEYAAAAREQAEARFYELDAADYDRELTNR
jgi:hypothetical protein